MENIINSTIRLDEVGQDQKKVNIKYGEQKFSFWLYKKDGAKTKAFESWEELKLVVGDDVDVQYKEEDAEWEKDGKTINFKRRTILQLRRSFVKAPASNTPQRSNPAATAPVGDFVTRKEFEEKIADMSAAFMRLQVDVANKEDKISIKLTDVPY